MQSVMLDYCNGLSGHLLLKEAFNMSVNTALVSSSMQTSCQSFCTETSKGSCLFLFKLGMLNRAYSVSTDLLSHCETSSCFVEREPEDDKRHFSPRD